MAEDADLTEDAFGILKILERALDLRGAGER